MSEYIGQMWVLWVEVDDEPGPDSLRSCVERNAIALLSNYDRQAEPIDPASDGWLGHWAASEGVRRSGLWNVDYTADACERGCRSVPPDRFLLRVDVRGFQAALLQSSAPILTGSAGGGRSGNVGFVVKILTAREQSLRIDDPGQFDLPDAGKRWTTGLTNRDAAVGTDHNRGGVVGDGDLRLD